MADFACRGCHRPIGDEAGCFLCLPIKAHLIPVEQADEDNVPLSKLATESASLLRNQLKQLTVLQKATTTYDPTLGNEARAHANALAKLLDSARKLQEDGAAAVEVMSFSEKANLMVEFFQGLPPAYRRQLHARLGQFVSNAEVQQEHLDDSAVN